MIFTILLVGELGVANETDVVVIAGGTVGFPITGAIAGEDVLVKRLLVSEPFPTIITLKPRRGVSLRPAMVLTGLIPCREEFAARSTPVHDCRRETRPKGAVENS